MLGFYLNLCLAIFLLHVVCACYLELYGAGKSLYEESKSGFWSQAVMLSIPFVNIIVVLVALYFYATLPAKMWDEE